MTEAVDIVTFIDSQHILNRTKRHLQRGSFFLKSVCSLQREFWALQKLLYGFCSKHLLKGKPS